MLVSLSANHRTTSFEALERLSTVGEDAGSRLRDAHDTIRGAVVLATCNRFEAYFELDEDAPHASAVPAMDSVMEELAGLARLPYRDVRTAVDFRHGNGVAHHLFAVASGLESVAVGEDEIAGQVRRAYDRSRAAGLTTPALESLFQRASETSRAVKSAARVGEAGRSLVRLALELASSRIADWSTARVLLVGTGRFAAASVAALRARGAEDIRVHSVSDATAADAAARGRAAQFAARHDLAEASGLADALAHADVVVTCTTTADAYAVTAGMLAPSARSGHAAPPAGPGDPARSAPERPPHSASGAPARSAPTTPGYRLLIDLGMPRNVEPAAADVPGVELLDLETIRRHASLDEFAELDEARQIVQAAAQRHAVARRVREVAPVVTAMRAAVQDVVDEEIARARARDAGPEAERAARHAAGVLLHRLIGQAHRLAASGEGDAWADAARIVFALDDER